MKLDSQLPGDSFALELTGIQMRMRQQAREIVSNVFMSEEETRALLTNEIDLAVRSVNWAQIVEKELKSQVHQAVSQLVQGFVQGLSWDKDIQGILKKRLIEKLQTPEEY
jgi:hypothetical protein